MMMSACFLLPHAAGRAAIVVALAIVRQSIAVEFDGSSFARNVSLDANLDIFWTIDTAAETIRLAVHAKAASGWAGVGISEMGGMEGADIVFYETETGNLTDAHSLAAGTPVIDECTQDWTLLSAEADDGSLVFDAERALDTGDAQDRVFADDSQDGAQSTRLLAAWGDSASISYHSADFAKGEIVLFGGDENDEEEPFSAFLADPDISFFDVTTKNFTIPTQRTWYERTCVLAPELPTTGEFHAVGFQGLFQDDTAQYVHHFIVRGHTAGDNCLTNSSDIFAWAPGGSDVELPDDIGILFGNASAGGYTSVSVETHYDNPNGDVGKTDSSGVRVYYTEELRPIEMGVMRLGDPWVILGGETLPEGKGGFSFDCPSSCTEEYFEVEEVTVFSHLLHAHENGQRIVTRQYRNDSSGNEVLVHTTEVEYYSFVQAGMYMVTNNGSVTIQKGDRFETECYYDTALSSVDSDNVTFGLGSENEMCIDFIFYYPNQRVPLSGSCGLAVCGGSLSGVVQLEDDHNFNRTFGTVDTCTASVIEDGEEEEASLPSRASVHGPGLFAFSTTAALAFGSITLMFGLQLN